MISLQRNKKGELVNAPGKRSRKTSIYNPGQNSDFKISRGKFQDFLSCKKCFYLDRVTGLKSPDTPPYTLNSATDTLYKKEFDICRIKQEPHRLLVKYNLNHIVPFNHPDIDMWRDALHYGLMCRYRNTNIILSGGIDDVWYNTQNQKLVIADYKSQVKKREKLNVRDYLSDVYHQGYKNQLEFYSFLLMNMGFQVDKTGYFVVCNVKINEEGFNQVMKFDELLVPYDLNSSWIPDKIEEMISVLNNPYIPQSHPSCMNCAYDNQRREHASE